MLLQQCNLAMFKTFCGQPAQKRYECSNGDEQILQKVHNNYRSLNLIGHYPFWVISPGNLTLFTRPFLAGRRVRVGHETRVGQGTTLGSSPLLLFTSVYSCPLPSEVGTGGGDSGPAGCSTPGLRAPSHVGRYTKRFHRLAPCN